MAPRRRKRATRWDQRGHLHIVLIVALALRLIYLAQISSGPFFHTPVFDAQNYDLFARAIVLRGTLDPQLFWQPVFYPLFLSLVYALTGCSILAATVVQLVVGSITCGLTYLLGRRIFDEKTGTVAGLIVAVYGPSLFYEGELLGNVWAAFWALALVLVMLQLNKDSKAGLWAIYGGVGGLAVLTRTTFLLAFLLSLMWLVWQMRGTRKSWQPALRPVVPALVALAMVVVPAGALCYRATGHFSIMAANGGINLYIGNNEHATETEAAAPWEYVHIRSLAAQAGHPGIWGEDRYFGRLAGAYIFQHPLSTATNLVRKAGQLVTSREIPGYQDIYLYRRWSLLLRLLVWKIGPFGFPFGVLLPMAVLGGIVAYRRIPVPLWLVLGVESAAMVFFHVVGRYRTTIVPLLAILCAAGVMWLIDAARRKDWAQFVKKLAVPILVVPLVSIPGPYQLEHLNTEAEMELSAGYYEQAEKRDALSAQEHYRRALALKPDFAPAHFNLATLLREQGRSSDAIKEYERAIEISPQYPEFHYNLGNALTAAGDRARAILEFREVIRLDPTSAGAHYNLGYLLTDLERPAEAAQHYQEAVRLDPAMIGAWVNLGLLRESSGDRTGAIQAYRSALEIDPAQPLAGRRLQQIQTSRPH